MDALRGHDGEGCHSVIFIFFIVLMFASPIVTMDDTVFSQQPAQSSFQWNDSFFLCCDSFVYLVLT